ncbi:hypothetical protein DFA_06093 [Cavenderia fasciculata]|uniref:Palmitoyltransferase n=1 Tax=Cavenderia fasciculata TaxID=261658 RepID=F4PK31_CACFS|nr:uncharacterized protein DFA_06093 [Cavenderia fasciculata]EGG23955.1 hypothetical protein DFA_06093 [Cavenderia fasciculata]|eukprot:XP_004361806.1 hypothetical protein DFA_06093 [Cavenderia fasciculata]
MRGFITTSATATATNNESNRTYLLCYKERERIDEKMKRYLFFVSLALIIIPSIIFAVFVLPSIFKRLGYGIIIAWAILLVLSLKSLIHARILDPGYLPKGTNESLKDEMRHMAINMGDPTSPSPSPSPHSIHHNNSNNEQSTSTNESCTDEDESDHSGRKSRNHSPGSGSRLVMSNNPQHQYHYNQQHHHNQQQQQQENYKKVKKTFYVNNKEIIIHKCKTCKIFRPPRTSHCTECNRCVLELDHHCPWIGNCVGKRNYRYFVYFVWSTVGLALTTMGSSLVNTIFLSQELGGFGKSIAASPVSILLVGFSFLLFWTLIGLGGFHLYLVSKYSTTREDIKGLKNPYAKGFFYNWKQFCCSSQTPSFPDESDDNRNHHHHNINNHNNNNNNNSTMVAKTTKVYPPATYNALPTSPSLGINDSINNNIGDNIIDVDDDDDYDDEYDYDQGIDSDDANHSTEAVNYDDDDDIQDRDSLTDDDRIILQHSPYQQINSPNPQHRNNSSVVVPLQQLASTSPNSSSFTTTTATNTTAMIQPIGIFDDEDPIEFEQHYKDSQKMRLLSSYDNGGRS